VIQEAIKSLCNGDDLNIETADLAIEEMINGRATPAQISAFLIALKMKGETPDEIFSFVKKLRENCLKIPIEKEGVIDLCGTGGDGKSTFNISTISAFVVAGANVKVAKHGNRAISSKCGSADLIEGLGIKLPDSPIKIKQAIEEIGIGFIFAPFFHPSMRNIQPVRREIGVRTIFNVLGPLINPAGVERQLIGFFEGETMRKVSSVLKKIGGKRFLLVSSKDGLDEISLFQPTQFILIDDGKTEEGEIIPEDFGFKMREANIKVKSVEESLKILFSVLKGEHSVFRDIILLNSGAAIFVSGIASNLKEGVDMAKESIDSKKAMKKLIDFIRFHREG
jgi:anthranilate phosphoribosyltransferase